MRPVRRNRPTSVARYRRDNAEESVKIPHLDPAQIESIALAISEGKVRKIRWSTVVSIAADITGFKYSRQALSGKKPISLAFAAKRRKEASGRDVPRRIRVRSGEDLATVAALRTQVAQRDRILENLRQELQNKDAVINRLNLRLLRWFSNTARRTAMTEEDLDQPIRYLPRQ
jgi:hypothetical protein